MKIKSSDSLELAFKKLYSSKNLFMLPDSAWEKHFTFESIRRYLDISRHLYRRWPHTIRYLESVHGESILTDTFDNFDSAARTYRNLNDAACGIFFNKISTTFPPINSELLLYEDYRNGKSINFEYITVRTPGRSCTLVPYNLDSIYTTLMFYGRAHAPSSLYRNLTLEEGKTYRKKL